VWVTISLVVVSNLTVAAGAVEEVEIPPLLRDFQARWESPAPGLFLGAAASTDRFNHHFRQAFRH
jgi:hypothetical protein